MGERGLRLRGVVRYAPLLFVAHLCVPVAGEHVLNFVGFITGGSPGAMDLAFFYQPGNATRMTLEKTKIDSRDGNGSASATSLSPSITRSVADPTAAI